MAEGFAIAASPIPNQLIHRAPNCLPENEIRFTLHEIREIFSKILSNFPFSSSTFRVGASPYYIEGLMSSRTEQTQKYVVTTIDKYGFLQ
jgi:hypothetical protein